MEAKCPLCGYEFENDYEACLKRAGGDTEKAYFMTRKICESCEADYRRSPFIQDAFNETGSAVPVNDPGMKSIVYQFVDGNYKLKTECNLEDWAPPADYRMVMTGQENMARSKKCNELLLPYFEVIYMVGKRNGYTRGYFYPEIIFNGERKLNG